MPAPETTARMMADLIEGPSLRCIVDEQRADR